MLDDSRCLDVDTAALALGSVGKIRRPRDPIALGDYAGVLVGAATLADGFSDSFGLLGVDHTVEQVPKMEIAW